MELNIKLKSGEEELLKALHFTDKPEEINIYRFVDAKSGGKVYLKLEVKDNQFIILSKDEEVDEDDVILNSKLEELLLQLNPSEASLGTEQTEVEDEKEETPYDPEKIRVDTKQLSLRQVFDMIEFDDIDLTPDFQRNLVWDDVRKARLIESVLLRIPLPIFYFAQDEDGKMSVVDGLQRLSTIHSFMKNNFKLNHLEYLQEKCKNKYYTHSDSSKAIDPKYFRWLNMTQITVNIIDPSSPFKLKYDIFRRINTGGQPLNSQEIRNCLASKSLRNTLRTMAKLDSFQIATGSSIKDVRMEAQELALRFILFHRKYEADPNLNNYSGNIESELNTLTETLSKEKNLDLSPYIVLFDNAMKIAYHLFGKYAFRKTQIKDIQPGGRRPLINKLLFVSSSILLSNLDYESIISNNLNCKLVQPLAQKITDDYTLFERLTWGTNARMNHQIAFSAVENIIKENLNY
ncbi:DUF262 domain-containing protein [Empedobacter sp.]|uniref:DUF262 domain-containing protein n=1 Tax=Empedobacter sp. TaxID=1927715 RepID=UPI0028AAD5E5|nr:DUF262 domain-containing protein [Empedobacter sp.]